MFANGSLQTTYSGPIYATGESLYRPRNEARAMAGLLGESRGYRQQGRGISAGSRLTQYQSGIAADRAARDQYDEAQKAEMAMIGSNADARSLYQRSSADELSKLRSLMLDRDRAQQSFDMNAAGDRIDAELNSKKLKAERYANAQARRGSVLQNILGIF